MPLYKSDPDIMVGEEAKAFRAWHTLYRQQKCSRHRKVRHLGYVYKCINVKKGPVIALYFRIC